MEQAYIEKAALEFAMNETGLDCIAEEACENGFIAGVQWRINAVWHDARGKVPEKFRSILVEREDSSFSVNMVGGNMSSCPLRWVRWAYIDDLLPERRNGNGTSK